jgi:hypothetical protein
MTFLKQSLNSSIREAQNEIDEYVTLSSSYSKSNQQQPEDLGLLEIVKNISKDPNEFYKDIGLFTHPRTTITKVY